LKKISIGQGAFLRLLSGAIAVQVVMSASNFIVGLMLIRRTAEAQYGYYVLIATAVLLSTTVQGSFIQPPMILRLTRSDQAQRADVIGGLLRDQARLIPFIAAVTALFAVVLQLMGHMTWSLASILVCGTVAVIAALRREFFRMVLFAYRRPNDVLRSDMVYCSLLVVGAFLATLSPFPAAVVALAMAVSCLVGGFLLSKALWRYEPWNPHAPRGILRELSPQGSWSAFGGSVHWLFSQGYNYLVAGTLDVSAVAALAATRLLVMPVGLLSTGINTLMLPTVSRWTNEHRAATVLKRLSLFAAGLAAMASCYLLVMWLGRDWIFEHLLKKSFVNRDLLLLLWSAIALATAFRDQLYYFLVTRARFRLTSVITFASAIVSFSVSFIAMQHYGVIGALMGLLAGEIFNVAGIVLFSVREARNTPEPLSKTT
jgi:O-antigen/teichoic acid export membrane protein